MRIELEFRDDKSQKFWHIWTEDDSQTVNYGRVGTKGQSKTKDFPNAAAAEADAEKQAAKKRKKGYVASEGDAKLTAAEVQPSKSAPAKPAMAKPATGEPATAKCAPAKAAPKKEVHVLARYTERVDAVEREIRGKIPSYKDEEVQRLQLSMAYIRSESDQLPSFEEEYYFESLVDIFAPIREWTEVDLRVLDVMLVGWIRRGTKYERGFHGEFYTWLRKQLAGEGNDDLYPRVLKWLGERGAADETLLRHTISKLDKVFEDAEHKPTSVGRYLLSRYPADADFMLSAGIGKRYGTTLCCLLARHARKDFDKQLPAWWKDSEWGAMQLARALMELDATAYLEGCKAVLARCEEPWPRFQIVESLHRHDPKGFAEEARAIAEENLKVIREKRKSEDNYRDHAWDSWTGSFKEKTPVVLEFLLTHFGYDVKPAVFEYFEEDTEGFAASHIAIAVEHLGQDALPLVTPGFRFSFAGKNTGFVTRLYELLNKLDWSEHHEKGWALVEHKSKLIREVAARGMSALGADAVSRGIELTKGKKQEQRHGGALVLGLLGDDVSLGALKDLVATEKSDDVRDPALETLHRAMNKRDQVVSDDEIMQRFERAKSTKKLAKPPFKWLDESSLPKLKWSGGELEGKALDADWVRYLVYRQTRQTGADIDTELLPVLEHIDRESSVGFATALWGGFLEAKANAKDKASAVLAGALGGEGIVDALAEKTTHWAGSGRGSLAEVCVHVLASIQSDVALRAIDELRRGKKGIASNVSDAAEEAFNNAADMRGLSAEELADRVVPDLGFVNGARSLDIGGEEYQVRLRSGFKLEYVAPSKGGKPGKVAKSLPKAADKSLKAEMKELADEVTSVAKAQKKRLTAAMCLGRRWNPETFKELMLTNAICIPFVVSIVWGKYDEKNKLVSTFRPLGDDSFASVDNDDVTLEKGTMIGIVHAAELSAEDKSAWIEHYLEHEVVAHLEQLGRAVTLCPKPKAGQRFCDDYVGHELSSDVLRGRLVQRGWRRGSVVDAGAISAFHRSFGPLDVDAILLVNNMNISGDTFEQASLERLMFVKDKSTMYGSYVYDEPKSEKDERLIALGELPRVVYSEVMGDLAALTA